jgi:hypothetical protein
VAAVGFNAARRLGFYRNRLPAMPPLEELAAAAAADEKALGDPAAAAVGGRDLGTWPGVALS